MKTISRKVLGLLAALVILVNSIGMLALTATATDYSGMTDKLYITATTDVPSVKTGEKFIVTYKIENYAAYYLQNGSKFLKTTPDGKIGKLEKLMVYFAYDKTAFTPSPLTSDEESGEITSVTKPLLHSSPAAEPSAVSSITIPGTGNMNFMYQAFGFALSKTDTQNDGFGLPTDNTDLFQVEFTALSTEEFEDYAFTINNIQTIFTQWKTQFKGGYPTVLANYPNGFNNYPVQADSFTMNVANQTAEPLVTSALDSAIFDAGVILGGAVQGTHVGQYSAEAYAAFDGAIDTAQGVLDNALLATPTVTQTDIDDAVTDLTTAQTNFKPRTADGDSAISQVSLVNGKLDQAFDPATTEYTITMAKAINWINIYPEVSRKASFVYQDDAAATIVTPKIFLNVVVPDLQKIIKIQVTAQDGTKTTYTFTINKPVVIKDVAVTFGQFTGINDELGTISVTANANATYVNISPFVAPGLSYTINGEAVKYASINVLGQTSVEVPMVVFNGATNKPYTVTITKAQDTDTSVKKLDLANATVSGSIINVTPGATSFLIVPIVAQTATYKLIVDGIDVTKAGRYQATKVASTPNLVVEVVVKAESGLEISTFYTVAREASTNNALTNIDLAYATTSGLTSESTITTKQLFFITPYVTKMATAKIFRDDTNVQISPATGSTYIYKAQNINRIRIEVKAENEVTKDYYFNIVYTG